MHVRHQGRPPRRQGKRRQGPDAPGGLRPLGAQRPGRHGDLSHRAVPPGVDGGPAIVHPDRAVHHHAGGQDAGGRAGAAGPSDPIQVPAGDFAGAGIHPQERDGPPGHQARKHFLEKWPIQVGGFWIGIHGFFSRCGRRRFAVHVKGIIIGGSQRLDKERHFFARNCRVRNLPGQDENTALERTRVAVAAIGIHRAASEHALRSLPNHQTDDEPGVPTTTECQ
mmetsp:Transcript_5789/g.14371  ORF Transcript_5789/g.14371 Transcript_5789/m.14371 type:complete len:223 (+) Transcript_5789:716-1384(+)